MADKFVTVGELFSIPDARRPGEQGKGEAPSRYREFKDRIVKELKEIQLPAAAPDLVQRIAELFDIQIPDLMITAWKKTDEIRQALDESRESPQETSSIDLTEHTITVELHPKVEIRMKGVLVKTLEFVVKLSLTLNGVSLEVRNGTIIEVRAGSCTGSGTIEYGDLVIAKKELEPIQLPGVLHLQETQISTD